LIKRVFDEQYQRLRSAILSKKSDSGDVLRGAITSFLIMFFGFIVGYSSQVFLARLSGQSEFGLYAYAWTWASALSMFLALGLNQAIMRIVPTYTAKGQYAHIKGLLILTPVLVFFCAVVACTIIAFIVAPIASKFAPEYVRPLNITFAICPFLAIITLFQGTGRALGAVVVTYAPRSIGIPLFVVLAAGLWISFGNTLDSTDILLFSLAACILFALVQAILLHKNLPDDIVKASPSYDVRSWLRISLPLLFASGMQLILNYADILMIGYYLNPSEIAIFHAATRTAILISGFLVAVNALAAPKIARFHADGKLSELQDFISEIIHWIFWPSLLATVIAILFGETILSAFGEEYTTGYQVLSILAIAQLINAGSGPVGYLMTMTGHHDVSAYVFGFSAVLNIILNAILIPLLGIMGAAIATATTMVLWNLTFIVLAQKRLNIRSYIFAKVQK